MPAKCEPLLVEGERLLFVVLLEKRPPAALLERLKPEGLGDVRDGLRESLQRRGSTLQTRGEAAPPGIKKRGNDVG